MNGSTFLAPEASRVARVSQTSGLRSAIQRARQHLLSLQQPDGHWVGELQGDTILESEYVLMMAFLGKEREEKVVKAARYLLTQQMPEGGWNNYPGGPANLSNTVKAYFALKLTGHSADAPYMHKARTVIRGLGGAGACNSFTRFYLALLGQFPYENCPTVPPEMMLLPRWLYFNIHAMSAWTRTIVVPLTIFWAHKPVRRLPDGLGITELFLESPLQRSWPSQPSARLLSWTNFFLLLDALLKRLESWEPAWLRRLAVQRAAAWMRERFVDSDGLGAIFPPMIYTVISLRCLGCGDDSPEMRWALNQLDDLMIEEDGVVRLQPCFSPVWDTALSVIGLCDSRTEFIPFDAIPTRMGAGRAKERNGRSESFPFRDSEPQTEDGALDQAVDWLLQREVRRPGDWCVNLPNVPPGGWVFEYRNGFYPDTDDTAMVVMALARAGAAQGKGRPAVQRALTWLLHMQDDDGGWAAFDRDINHKILEKVPFADHNAMLDPSCPDITARVLEALGHFGYRSDHPRVRRALAFIRRTQEKSGCWPGRWGVNYIYGTWQVLQGLRKIDLDRDDPMVRKAADWFRSVQQPGGGWGESCASYDDPSLAGQGTPTASQTAWALLGLLAAGEEDSDAVRRGIDYLLSTQQLDGNWHEEPFTGTGFPKVFYLKYHMYRLYFPLMALARYAASADV